MSVNPRFFRIVDGIKVVDLAVQISAMISGRVADQFITGVAPLAVAGEGEVTLLAPGSWQIMRLKSALSSSLRPILRPNLLKKLNLRVCKRS